MKNFRSLNILIERRLLFIAIAAATIFIVGGFSLAWWTHDAEWVKRSGSAIVASEFLIAILGNRRKNRFEQIPAHLREKNKYIQEEIHRADSKLLYVVIILAASGEFLQGFGDLIFKFWADHT